MSAESKQPPLLEQLGALGSLLIHDMANQMCIISGNATFAQMMLADPQQVGRAVEAIAKSGERMSFILGQCADLRRRLASELPRGEAGEAAQAIRELFASQSEWTIEVLEGLDGELYVPSDWVVFALSQCLAEISDVGEGQVRVRRVQPDEETSFFPGGSYFEVRLSWESATPLSVDEVRSRYENFGLLAAFELIRQCGGKLEGSTPAAGRQELLVCVPYLYEPPEPPRAGK